MAFWFFSSKQAVEVERKLKLLVRETYLEWDLVLPLPTLARELEIPIIQP